MRSRDPPARRRRALEPSRGTEQGSSSTRRPDDVPSPDPPADRDPTDRTTGERRYTINGRFGGLQPRPARPGCTGHCHMATARRAAVFTHSARSGSAGLDPRGSSSSTHVHVSRASYTTSSPRPCLPSSPLRFHGRIPAWAGVRGLFSNVLPLRPRQAHPQPVTLNLAKLTLNL